jgi:hypothetical protein
MGQVLLESYDYILAKNWLSQELLQRRSTGKKIKVTTDRRRPLDDALALVMGQRFDEMTKTVFVQLAFDHFACSIHQPQVACHAVFCGTPAPVWVNHYKPVVSNFANKIRSETYSFDGLRGVETVFSDLQFVMERHMSQGITSVHHLRDEAAGTVAFEWEHDHLQAVLFAIRTLPGMSVRHGPVMEFLAHQRFCRAVCARQDVFYGQFISLEPSVLALILAKAAIEFDEGLSYHKA